MTAARTLTDADAEAIDGRDSPLFAHYDLTAGRREAALAAGAVFVPAKDQARKRIAERAARGGVDFSPAIPRTSAPSRK